MRKVRLLEQGQGSHLAHRSRSPYVWPEADLPEDGKGRIAALPCGVQPALIDTAMQHSRYSSICAGSRLITMW